MNSNIWVLGNGAYGHGSFYLGAMYVPILTITFPTQLFEAPPEPWTCAPDLAREDRMPRRQEALQQ